MNADKVALLNTQITEAIRHAITEEYRDPASARTRAAYVKVSVLEEQLAEHADSVSERNIGRRGAITAALKANNRERALSLLECYRNNLEFDTKSKRQMQKLLANTPAMEIPS